MYGIENVDGYIEQIEGIKGFDSEGLSNIQNDYLDEALETQDPELIVNRIDELCDRVPPKAIDANWVISERLGNLKESIDNKYLEAPNDFEQVQQISEKMTGIEGTRFEEWQNLSPQERLNVMQKVENSVAEIAHRPSCEVKGESLGMGHLGYYNPNNNTITLNMDYLDGSSYESYKEMLDTIIHEGRHAYQYYNIDYRQVHPSDGDCTNWSENLHENKWGLFPENYGYQSVEEVGFQRYWMQPVEADARAFATDVFNKFNQMV